MCVHVYNYQLFSLGYLFKINLGSPVYRAFCVLFATFYLVSYRVLNNSMLNVRDDLFLSFILAFFFRKTYHP